MLLRIPPLLAVITCAGLTAATGQDLSSRQARSLHVHQEQHAKLRIAYRADMEKLATWCETQGLIEAAGRTRNLATVGNTGGLSEPDLPRAAQPDVPAGATGNQREWQIRLRGLRQEHANDLYKLSRIVLRNSLASYAMQLVREAAVVDPDHSNARRLLGYVLYRDPMRKDEPDYAGEWVTPFAARMMGPPQRHVWHDRFGWIPRTHVEKYERGLRPWKRDWISAAKEAQLRRDFANAWEVRTEHFLVKTDYSLERGVEIAARLEDYYRFFRRTFAAFFETPEELQKRFVGNQRRRIGRENTRPMEVHYYRNKEEYVARLIRKIPRIAMTEGLYYEQDKTSYFYHDENRDGDGTLYHEATHQFFDMHTDKHRLEAAKLRARQSRQRNWTNWIIGDTSNFWIVEGIACYMESFQRKADSVSLGDPGYLRFRAAHIRLVRDDYYIPLRQFSGMGIKEFQSLPTPEIARAYTQASGLVHFLMHYDNGRYREPLINFLGQLYRPNLRNLAERPSLEAITGVRFEELDVQYRSYMENLTDLRQASGG